ncbi:MAG: flagellar hook-associated protein FlgK [Alphaproteobacteria bacterium]|jgi:flagellar hook-associated protein 1 FlgK|uniref:Flagellar hook-associated protein 1 n=1 Tax=Peteryoungia algae TaxID=2919917 RepID=A0ABT0CW07_9HYPH|nr:MULTISPECIES: flagellar hook-associated protein FlgK [unclassified Rhizobium]MBU2327490.1 flagellar hook-associated protein FlgK [Alphaproteobacteria bacterium]MCC8931396.1 flagellar hook-associated protein FlgK [Rhizobium sp. 'Codium 1']MCJ8237351.1 flagellar hook-associated protein FlgK [Rhizobium sp. SSM4.3]
MSLASSLNTANSIFRNTAQQTSVISTNIANTGNENYVRRDAVVVQTVYGFSSVQNERSQQMALLRQMSSSTAQQSAQSTLLDGLTTLSDALGGNDYELSPSAYLANLQSSLQSFAASPGEYALASTVVTDAIDVVNSLNNATTTTQELREDTDAQMFEQVDTLNKLLAEFKIVNDTVVRQTATGGNADDYLDRRDTLLKEISAIVGVSVNMRDNSDMVLYTYDGTTLFETDPREVSFVRTYTYDSTVTGNAIYIDGTAVRAGVGGNTDGQGSLASLVQIRDVIAPTFQTQLDEIARGLIEAFQETDIGGGGELPGLFTWPGGTIPATGTVEPGLAALIRVNTAVRSDAGGDPMLIRDGGINGATYVQNVDGSSGYTDLINAYVDELAANRSFSADADLKTDASVLSFASNSIGWLEELRSNATTANENKQALYERTFQTYSSKTAVSLDEELSLLLDVEQSYKAAAKLVSTVDEMLKAVLEMAG